MNGERAACAACFPAALCCLTSLFCESGFVPGSESLTPYGARPGLGQGGVACATLLRIGDPLRTVSYHPIPWKAAALLVWATSPREGGSRACAVADDRLAGRDVPVPIGRISWSLNSSMRCCFSFPLRYLFAIGYQSSYLALDGHHHPYSVRTLNLAYSRARPQPRFATRIVFNAPCPQDFYLRSAVVPGFLRPALGLQLPPKKVGFSLGLIHFHSPLLMESRLISFPPPIDMLKFGGLPTWSVGAY